MASQLFTPFTMRGLQLSNRIVVSPMGQYSARNGIASGWHHMHLGNLAVSGAGLVITEATAVHPSGLLSPRDLGLWSDEHAAALEPVIAFCREHGRAALGMQLWHSGRKGSVTVAWERQQYIPKDKGGWTTYSASPIAYPGRGVPDALDEVARIVRDLFQAASRAAVECRRLRRVTPRYEQCLAAVEESLQNFEGYVIMAKLMKGSS